MLGEPKLNHVIEKKYIEAIIRHIKKKEGRLRTPGTDKVQHVRFTNIFTDQGLGRVVGTAAQRLAAPRACRPSVPGGGLAVTHQTPNK